MLKRVLKIAGWIAGTLIGIILLLFLYIQMSWDRPIGRRIPVMKARLDSATVARGEFLYMYGATCWMCHGGENRSPNSLPSGGAVEDLHDFGPGFGIFPIPNITPDSATGIGLWTDGELVRLLREGVNRNGRPVFIMPAERFNGLSDEDVLSLVAYMRTRPPVHNLVPPIQPSLFTKALFTFGAMKAFPEVTAEVKAPARGVTLEWGKYLTAHASVCMDCHSPLDLSNGQFYNDSLLTGGNIPFGKKGIGQAFDAPAFAFGRNITPDPETGIGTWTERQFLNAMQMGIRPDGTVLTNHMPYSYIGLWPEEDLQAVFKYLMSLAPVRKAVPPVEMRKEITEARGVPRGNALFDTYCFSCHGLAGAGAPPTKLVLAEIANTIDDKTLKNFIADGQLNLRMPGFAKTLTSEQLDDVVSYIRTLKK